MHSATAAATTLAAFLFTCTCVLCYTSGLHGVFWADTCPFVPFHLSHQDSSSQGACSKFPEHLAFPELHQRLWSAPPRMQHICSDAASLIHPSRCRYYITGGTRSTALGFGVQGFGFARFLLLQVLHHRRQQVHRAGLWGSGFGVFRALKMVQVLHHGRHQVHRAGRRAPPGRRRRAQRGRARPGRPRGPHRVRPPAGGERPGRGAAARPPGGGPAARTGPVPGGVPYIPATLE